MSAPQIVDLAVTDTEIDGLKIIRMRQVTDERGTVREFYRQSAWLEAGLPDLGPWLQLNVTETRRGAVRGLHGEAMTKLVGIVTGTAFGAYVDLRTDSPTAGSVVTVELAAGTQVLVPQGVGNGFQSTSEISQYVYCFDDEWRPGMAGTAVNPLSAALHIRWPVPVDRADPSVISAKDAGAPEFSPADR